MNRARRFLFCVVILSFSASILHAEPQTQPQTETRTKTDSVKTTLLRSLDRLHLGDPDAAWHLTASVQLLDNGKPGDTGTIETLHSADGDTRTIYAFPNFHQALTRTAQGRFREGDEGEAPAGLSEFLHFLEKPADTKLLDTAQWKTFRSKSKAVDLQCIHTISYTVHLAHHKEIFCNIAGSPVIRYAALQSSYATFLVKVDAFQGGDVPAVAVVFFDKIPIARLQLTFAPLSAEDQARIQPPANAVQVHGNTSKQGTRQITRDLILPSVLPASVPMLAISDLPSSFLLRLELDSSGKITNIRTVAAADPRSARQFASTLLGRQLQGTSTSSAPRFVNFAFARTTNDDIYGSLLDAIGPNPGGIPAPPIGDH